MTNAEEMKKLSDESSKVKAVREQASRFLLILDEEMRKAAMEGAVEYELQYDDLEKNENKRKLNDLFFMGVSIDGAKPYVDVCEVQHAVGSELHRLGFEAMWAPVTAATTSKYVISWKKPKPEHKI